MCAINPKHKDNYILRVYTSHPTMTKEEFDKLVLEKLTELEVQLNNDTRLRWHVEESNHWIL